MRWSRPPACWPGSTAAGSTRRPAELSYAITSAVARRQSGLIREVAAKLPGLEKHVMSSRLRDPEALLETMFLIRHELITTRTMAAQCHDIWVRMDEINRLADHEDAPTPATWPTSSSACGPSRTASRCSCSG